MSVVVAQLGARMHYAVPRLLDRAGLLEHLYTDICARKDWPGLLRFIPPALRPAGIQRLLGRDPAGIPASRITAFTGFGLDYARRLARARTTDERNATYLWSGREFAVRSSTGASAGRRRSTFSTPPGSKFCRPRATVGSRESLSRPLRRARSNGPRSATKRCVFPNGKRPRPRIR